MKGGFPSRYDWISWLVAASFFRRLYFELLSRGILISPLYWVIHSHVMTTGIWIQVSSDPMNIHIHTNTNRCLFSFHCSWPSQCLSGVLLWHRSGTNNLCSLPFFCAHPITLTFSGGGKRDTDDCFLWLLFNRVSGYGGAWVLFCMWRVTFSFRSSLWGL